ncbi:MAG: hypothetical protein AABX52_00035 [Nanoarchaeota archaeon]
MKQFLVFVCCLMIMLPSSIAQEGNDFEDVDILSDGAILDQYILSLSSGEVLEVEELTNAKVVVHGSDVTFSGIKKGTFSKDEFDVVLSTSQGSISIGRPPIEASNIPAGSQVVYKEGRLRIVPPPNQKTLPIEVPRDSKIKYSDGVYRVESASGATIGSAVLKGSAEIKEDTIKTRYSFLSVGGVTFQPQEETMFKINGDVVNIEGSVRVSGYAGSRSVGIEGKGSYDTTNHRIDMKSGSVIEAKIMFASKEQFSVALGSTNNPIGNGAAIIFGKAKVNNKAFDAASVELFGSVQGAILIDASNDKWKKFTSSGGTLRLDKTTFPYKSKLYNPDELLRIQGRGVAYVGGPLNPGEMVVASEINPFDGLSKRFGVVSFVPRDEARQRASTGDVLESYQRFSRYRNRVEHAPHEAVMADHFGKLLKNDAKRFRSLLADNGMEILIPHLSKSDVQKEAIDELSRRYGTSQFLKDQRLARAIRIGDTIQADEINSIIDAETIITRNLGAMDQANIQKALKSLGRYTYTKSGQQMLRDPKTIRDLNTVLSASAIGDFNSIQDASRRLDRLGIKGVDTLLDLHTGFGIPSYDPQSQGLGLRADGLIEGARATIHALTGASIQPETIKTLKRASNLLGNREEKIQTIQKFFEKPLQSEFFGRVIGAMESVPEEPIVLNKLGLLSLRETEQKHGPILMSGASQEATQLAGVSMALSEYGYRIPVPDDPTVLEMMRDPFTPKKEKTLFIVDKRMGSVIQVDPGGIVSKPDADIAEKLRYMRDSSRGGYSSAELTEVYRKYNVLEIRPESSVYDSIDPAILRAAESNAWFGQAMGLLVGYNLFTKLGSKNSGFQDDIIDGNIVFQGKRGIGLFDDRMRFWKDLAKRIESRRRVNQLAVSAPATASPPSKVSAAQERAMSLRQRARTLLGRQN